jgi:SWI/SNF related-matrix-associated actin-dependent regulator of chromatin subfamily C
LFSTNEYPMHEDVAALFHERSPLTAVHAGGKLQFFCNAMPWVDCTACRYHCTRIPDIDLCPQAFAEGRFPPGTCSKDFIKIDSKVSKSKHSGWSDQEQLLLLEAIEMFGENFDKVAEHVGTKNKLDCVMQFLQMPIDEECVKNLRHSQVPRVCRLQS